MKLTPIDKASSGVLQSRQFVAGLYVLAGLGGLLASFNLAVDRLVLLASPTATLNCDISEEVSCGKVDQSWQASLMHFGDTPVPNAFIGLIAYTILITVGVSLAAGVTFPKWFSRSALAGQLIMLVFSYWLLSQSFFGWLQKPGEEDHYGALCPWCVLLMFSTTIMTFMLSHILVLQDGGKKPGRVLGLPETLRAKWAHLITSSLQYMILIAWVMLIAICIIFKYKATLLGI